MPEDDATPTPIGKESPDARFVTALDGIAAGHTQGRFANRRWNVTVDRSPDGRRQWLYGEALDGSDRVSFNLYRLAAGLVLRPCEMPIAKVTAFVLGYRPDA